MALFTKTTTIHLDVQGMTCGNCVRHVTEALESVDGVKRVEVDLEKAHAEVHAKPNVDLERLKHAVAEAGYTATPKTS